ncbi:hypothetical protein [Streptacidiphilus sp. P02-A3a]|uniref:hypothetical protein n=1 Tax=Streptacidiphilus sp. P02-A3a TaxID=2704468 RepID=UPI0015FDB64A|nr:hypothetical protein [Streptacidiphilus sp. P02-A3a]QMU67821.1 hypothetical protein GXP74_05835 [Streptacidiphilus sp. P02-A3a]
MQPYGDSELKKDLHAAVRTAQELGPDYESEVLDSFLSRLDSRLDANIAVRVQRELGRRQGEDAEAGPGRRGGFGSRFQYFSLVLAIPLSAIGGGTNGLPGLITAWLGIVGVNLAHSWSEAAARRREERLAAGSGRDGWD